MPRTAAAPRAMVPESASMASSTAMVRTKMGGRRRLSEGAGGRGAIVVPVPSNDKHQLRSCQRHEHTTPLASRAQRRPPPPRLGVACIPRECQGRSPQGDRSPRGTNSRELRLRGGVAADMSSCWPLSCSCWRWRLGPTDRQAGDHVAQDEQAPQQDVRPLARRDRGLPLRRDAPARRTQPDGPAAATRFRRRRRAGSVDG